MEQITRTSAFIPTCHPAKNQAAGREASRFRRSHEPFSSSVISVPTPGRSPPTTLRPNFCLPSHAAEVFSGWGGRWTPHPSEARAPELLGVSPHLPRISNTAHSARAPGLASRLRERPGMSRGYEFREDEVHIHHNGTVWLVTHLEVQRRFEMLARAMMDANYLRDQHRGEHRLRVILHRADTPLAK
jgi:hypothetical protein